MGDELKKYLQSLKDTTDVSEPEELTDEKPLSFGEIVGKSLTNPLDLRIFGLNPHTIGKSVYEGVKSAVETQEESEKAILQGDVIGGQLGKMSAVVEGGFGLGTAVSPHLMAFTQGMEDLSKVVPEEVMKYAAPVTALTEPKTLGGRSAAKMADVLLQLGFIKGVGKVLPKGTGLKEAKPIKTSKEVKPEIKPEIKPEVALEKPVETKPLTPKSEVKGEPQFRTPEEIDQIGKKKTKDRTEQEQVDIYFNKNFAFDGKTGKWIDVNQSGGKYSESPMSQELINRHKESALSNLRALKEQPPKPETPKSEVKPKTTTIKNAVVNQERKARGLDPIETSMKREWGKVWDEAKLKIETGQIDPVKLSKELSEKPRPVTDTESAILTYERTRLKEQQVKLLDEISKTKELETKAKLDLELLELQEKFNTTELASKHSGTEVARALGIRRMEIKEDYTLAPLIQRARTANKNQPIPEDLRVKLQDYSKKIAEGEQKVKVLEAKLSNLEAENFLRDLVGEKFKRRSERRTVAKEALDAEYDTLVKEWATTQNLNALVDPKQVQLMVKMATNRLQKGGVTIEQVVDQIYQVGKKYIKDLSVEDVRNALRGGDRFAKMSEKEIKSEIRGIRKQTSMETLQKSYKTRLTNRKAELEEMLRTGNYERKPRRKTEMNPELRELKDQVDVLKQHADREIRLLERKNRTAGEKVKETIIDVANIPRTVKASFDLSAPLRQGVILAAGHPKIIFGRKGAFSQMFRYFKSDKALRDLQLRIEESPNASLYNKSKLYLANEKTNIGRVSGREEAFMSTLPEKIPIAGIGIKASNRAYAGFLDQARMDISDYYYSQFKRMGKTFESDPKLYKDLSKAINTMSGRGTLGGFEKSAAALSIGIFSPRLIASRLQMMNPRFYFKLSPEVRKIVTKDMLSFVGMGLGILSMAKLAGADVESDPRSSDFGKIKVGNTRIDVWGGFQQYGVFFARQIMNSTKTSAGDVKSLSGKEFPFTTRLDLAKRFGEQKLSPTFGLMRDFLNDKTFMGEEFEWGKQALDLMTPLYLKDLYEAAEIDGIEGLLLTLPGVFGVGAQTYKRKTKTKSKGF